jgi:hypothetical protein
MNYYVNTGLLIQNCISKYKNSAACACPHVNCADSLHKTSVNELYVSIVNCLAVCSKNLYKVVSPRSFNWSTELSELKQQNKVAHSRMV